MRNLLFAVGLSSFLFAASAHAEDSVARARFTTTASAADVSKAACTLDATAEIGGRFVPVAIAVDGVVCEPKKPDALELSVRSERGADGKVLVVVDSNVVAASDSTTAELREVVRSVGTELRRRVSTSTPAVVAPSRSTTAIRPNPDARPDSPARVATTVGAGVLAAIAVAGTVALVVGAAVGISSLGKTSFNFGSWH